MDIAEYQHAEDMKIVAEYLLRNNLVSGALEGISKVISTKGWNSLSEKQQYAFDAYALPKATLECSRCGIEIPFNELECNDTGLCSWCLHQMDKIERE